MIKENFCKLYLRNSGKYTGAAKMAAVIAAIFCISFGTGFILGASRPAEINERQAIDEVRHLLPPELNGLSVGVMFDSISTRRYWWTHTATEDRFLLPNRETTWVHFFGETDKGYMHASINLDRSRGRVNYHMFVGGRPIRLNDLYEMFR